LSSARIKQRRDQGPLEVGVAAPSRGASNATMTSHFGHPMHLAHLICVCLMPIALTGCGGASRPSGFVPQGSWGGDHVELVLDAAHGTIEFDCAHGRMQAPIPVDPDGAFHVAGIFVREHGGPIRDGEPPDQHPARYNGTTNGRRMTLIVTLSDESQQIGTFELVLGGPPRLLKCL
jgi:hypothetical protein